jgi:hypothetical protein
MKRISLLACATLLSFFSIQAFSTPCGPYIGLGVGKSWFKSPDSNIFVVPPGGTSTHMLSGTGERAFVGFNVNKYFGIEGGYTHYARALYVGRLPAGAAYSALTYYPHTYDIVGKLYMPLGMTGFNIYALGGVARVVETVQFNNGGIPTNGKVAPPNTFSLGSNQTHGYNNRPIYGLGVNYNFTRHFLANIEVTQIQSLNSFSNSNTAVPYMNLATLNIAYGFD